MTSDAGLLLPRELDEHLDLNTPLSAENQFGQQGTFQVERPDLLCAPTVKLDVRQLQ